MADYTEEELAALSPTEREALTGGYEDDDETLSDIAGDTDNGEDDGDTGDDDDDDDESPADEKPAEAPETEEPSTEEAPEPATVILVSDDFDLDSVPAVNFTPKLSGEILPEFEAQIESLDEQLDAGDISAAEHRREVRKVEAASNNQEIGGQLWQAEQAAFFRANPELRQDKNPEGWAELNKELLKVANDPATRNMTGIQNLCLAKHNIAEAKEFAAFKASRKAGATPDAPAAKTVPKKPSAAKPNQQTLRDVPAADMPEVGQDKFAHLDKLSGLKLEAAIANMSPAEQKAYLEGV